MQKQSNNFLISTRIGRSDKTEHQGNQVCHLNTVLITGAALSHRFGMLRGVLARSSNAFVNRQCWCEWWCCVIIEDWSEKNSAECEEVYLLESPPDYGVYDEL